MAGPAKLTLKIGGELTASFKKSIKTAQKQLSTFNQNVKRSINDAASGAAKGFKNVIRNDAFQAAAVGAAGIGTALTASVKTAMNFESAMLRVKAISGSTTQEFSQLQAKAKELGRTTQFSASEAAGAMEFLAMAGFKTNDILSATPGLLNLAGISNMELAETADIASNVLGAMGLDVKETGRLVDVFAKTASNGNVDVRMLGETFKYVAPVAKQAGASLEDMGAAMAILGDNGIQASLAGTGLRSVLLRLAAPPTEAAKALDRLSVTTKDSSGNMRPFGNILTDVNKRMEDLNLGSAERLEIQNALFGKTAIATGAILQEAAANGTLAERVKTVTDSQGAAAEMAKTMQSGLGGTMKRLQSAAEGLAIAFGGPLLGPIASVAEGLASMLSPVAGLLEASPVLATAVGALGAAFVGLVVALPILGALKGAVVALGITAAGVGAVLTSPFVLTVAAVVGVIAIFQVLYNKVEWFRNGVDAILAGLGAAWNFFAAGISSAWDAAVSYLTPIFESFGQMFSGIVQTIQGVWQVFAGIFTGDGEKAVEGVKNIFGGLSEWFSGWLGVLSGVFAPITEILTGAFQSAVNLLQPIIDGISAIFGNVIQILQGYWQVFTSLFKGDFQGAADGIAQIVSGFAGIFEIAIDGIKVLWNGLLSHVKNIGNQIVEFFMSLPGKLLNVGGAIIDTIKDGFASRFEALKGTVVSSFQELRKLLPFSDAKEGPFRDLTASGRAIVETISKGIIDRQRQMETAMREMAETGKAAFSDAMGQPITTAEITPQISAPSLPALTQPVTRQVLPTRDEPPARPAPISQPRRQNNQLSGVLGGLMQLVGAAIPEAKPFIDPTKQIIGAITQASEIKSSKPTETEASPAPFGGLMQPVASPPPFESGFSRFSTAPQNLFTPQIPQATKGEGFGQPPAGGGLATATLAPVVNVNVTQSDASPEQIAMAVREGLEDALSETEAGMRALLND